MSRDHVEPGGERGIPHTELADHDGDDDEDGADRHIGFNEFRENADDRRKNAVQDAKGESKLPVADKTCRKADAHADRKF